MALEAAAGTSHHGRAPRKRGLSLALYFCCCACGDHNQRGTARTHRNLECCASSPKTAGDSALTPRDKRSGHGVGDRSWHVAPRAGADGEWPLASAVPLYWA